MSVVSDRRTADYESCVIFSAIGVSVFLGLLLWSPSSFALDRSYCNLCNNAGSPTGGHYPDPEAGLAAANSLVSVCINHPGGCVFTFSSPGPWQSHTNGREVRYWSFRRATNSPPYTEVSGVQERRCPEGRVPTEASLAAGRLLGCTTGECPAGTIRNEFGICIPIEPSPGPLPTNSDANAPKQGAPCP